MKQAALLIIFAIITFFGGLWLIRYAFSIPAPSVIMHKETAFLAFTFPYVVHALIVGLLFGAPFGYLVQRQVVLRSFLTVLPTPILFGLFSTWPANKWVPIIGYAAMILFFCGFAYLTYSQKKMRMKA